MPSLTPLPFFPLRLSSSYSCTPPQANSSSQEWSRSFLSLFRNLLSVSRWLCWLALDTSLDSLARLADLTSVRSMTVSLGSLALLVEPLDVILVRKGKVSLLPRMTSRSLSSVCFGLWSRKASSVGRGRGLGGVCLPVLGSCFRVYCDFEW